MWTCPKCGESLENQFDSCWKCAGQAVERPPLATTALPWPAALGLGLLFEMTLLVLAALLPHDSWLSVQAWNCLLVSHYLFLCLLNAGPQWIALSVLEAFLAIGLMAVLWALLLRWVGALLRAGAARLGLSGRQRRWAWWSAGTLAVAALGFKAAELWADQPAPFSPAPAVRAVVTGNIAFALDLYNTLKAHPGNLFFSPFSISSGLAMIFAGARGQTADEMAQVAHFGVSPAELHPAFGELFRRMDRLQHWRRLTLLTANGLWCQTNYSFAQPFVDVLRTEYCAQARPADFRCDAPAVTRDINAWISAHTCGRIPALLEPDRLDSSNRLVLCNAIYFKGRWKSQFKPGNTRPAPFYVSEDESVSVPTMAQESKLRVGWLEDPAATLLELPYYGGDLAMVIILPRAPDGLAELENTLTAEKLASWLARLEARPPYETRVFLPRFTTRQTLDLKPLLCSLGMTSAFGTNADLSAMDGTHNLFLSDALHTAFVEVNESGTEAAAITIMAAKSRGGPQVFRADHPFLFLIRDKGSGTLLFLGRLADPR